MIWWMPPIRQIEYFAMMVPFFHSLQDLPFAYRLDKPDQRSNYQLYISLRVAALLLVGFLAFELVPNLLDEQLNIFSYKNVYFFLLAFVVFINVYHFFIDSVTWKFADKKVRDKLLYAE